jgi:hypothetical protein
VGVRAGLEIEGIYRLSGSAMHLQIFRDVFDKGEVPNFPGYNADAHVVAGLLKKFLREMAEPVIPFALYPKFLEVARSGASRAPPLCAHCADWCVRACREEPQGVHGAVPRAVLCVAPCVHSCMSGG